MPRIAITKRINGLLSYIVQKHGKRSLQEPKEAAIHIYCIDTDELYWFTCDDPVLLVELYGVYKFNPAAESIYLGFVAMQSYPVLAEGVAHHGNRN